MQQKKKTENHGLLRRFIKKGGSIGELAPEIIEMAAEWNNNLPRKILGCMTPIEAFAQELMKIKGAIAA
jgi:IS30 family transposase